MKKLIALAFLVSPLSVFAQNTVVGEINTVDGIFTRFTSLGNAFVIVLISLSVVWIIFNVVRYLVISGEEERKKGAHAILYGVIALFVILSIWGLVAILKNTFGTQNTVPTESFPKIIDPLTRQPRN